MIYATVHAELAPSEDGRRNPHAELDNALGVAGWGTPFDAPRYTPPRDPAAPLWWLGEEEATAKFLAARGMR